MELCPAALGQHGYTPDSIFDDSRDSCHQFISTDGRDLHKIMILQLVSEWIRPPYILRRAELVSCCLSHKHSCCLQYSFLGWVWHTLPPGSGVLLRLRLLFWNKRDSGLLTIVGDFKRFALVPSLTHPNFQFFKNKYCYRACTFS